MHKVMWRSNPSTKNVLQDRSFGENECKHPRKFHSQLIDSLSIVLTDTSFFTDLCCSHVMDVNYLPLTEVKHLGSNTVFRKFRRISNVSSLTIDVTINHRNLSWFDLVIRFHYISIFDNYLLPNLLNEFIIRNF